LAANQRPADSGTALLDSPARRRRHPDFEALLRYAAARFGTARALFVWTEAEEPWVYAARLEGGRIEEDRLQPEALHPPIAEPAGGGAFLFDQASGRILLRRGAIMRKLEVVATPLHPEIAGRYGARRGLRIPVRSGTLQGDLFVLDVPGMCSDDLQIAEEAGQRIAAALEQRERMQATEEAAEMRARLSLARDLHDSVVQFLAGFTFRLEGTKKAAAAGRSVQEDIEGLQHELVGEQRDLRRLIAELRGTGGGEGASDLAQSVGALGRRIAAQWDVEFRLAPTTGAIEVPAHIDRHVGQLVREAAANAVRHGGATRIETRLEQVDGRLELEISDDGSGFPTSGEFDDDELHDRRIGPLSLRERVHNLGGRLRLRSCPDGATLNIVLPLEPA
jgi:signal transduction histidine kinase